MTELDQLILLFTRMGAGPEQAKAMAAQSIKRCDQWVAERGMARTEAMATLLQLVIKGRNGETPPGFSATNPPDTRASSPESR